MPIKSIWNYVHKGLLAILGILIIATIGAMFYLGHTLIDLNKLITQGGNGIGSVLVLQDILNDVQVMQSSARGYVISGDASFLAPYETARKQLPDDLRIFTNNPNSPISDKKTSQITSLITQESTFLANLITTRNDQGYDAAQAMVSDKSSEDTMNQLRQNITHISSMGLRNIGPKQARSGEEIERALVVGTAMSLLVLVACAAVMWYFRRAILKERALESSKNEFLSLASHQLRTPATNVKQYIGLLMDGYMGELSDSQRKALQVAYKNNEAEIKIMNDLLDVAKLDLQRIQLHKSVVNIMSVVREVIKNSSPQAREWNQKIELAGPQKLMATVDKTYVRGILENLLDNAMKYSHADTKITVTVSREQDMVCISVKDKGLGIKKRDYGKLFHKFSRLTNEFSANSQGSGLGLYWVKQVVKLHGGHIHVSSRDGKGSVFSVYLPVR